MRISDWSSDVCSSDLLHDVDQAAHADAADLLVIGKREVDRRFQAALQKAGGEGQRDGEEALHVRRAAAVEPAFLLRRLEGVGCPILAVDGYDIGVAETGRASCRAGGCQ